MMHDADRGEPYRDIDLVIGAVAQKILTRPLDNRWNMCYHPW